MTTVLIIFGVVVIIFIIYYWFAFVIPILPRLNLQGNASSRVSKWQYLGELIHPNSRHTPTIWSGTHPKILEWVRKEFTKRQADLTGHACIYLCYQGVGLVPKFHLGRFRLSLLALGFSHYCPFGWGLMFDSS